ncbi:hypothetical protein Tco_0063966 [Tanacetum coccineum]
MVTLSTSCTCVRCGILSWKGDFCSFCNSEAETSCSFMIHIRILSMIPPNVFPPTTLPQPPVRDILVLVIVEMIFTMVKIVQHGSRLQKIDELLQMMQSFCEKLLQQKQAASIDQSPLQEMRMKNMIDELKGKFNGMSIEINKKKELQHLEQVANLSTYPSQRFKSFCYDDDDDYDYEKNFGTQELLSSWNENLALFLEKGIRHKFIKSSVETYFACHILLFPILNEDSSDDESLSDEDVLEDNVKIYSNPLFEFNDEYISSNVNPLFDEVLENIESKDSYVSNLDELSLLVTPFSDANEDECFDPRGEINEIDAFLDMDISTDIENGYHDSKGDIIYLESLLIDATVSNLPPEVFLDHYPRSLKDELDKEDLKSMDKVFDLGIHEKTFSLTYVSLPFEDHHYLSLTYVIRIFLPYFTYPVESSLPLSSGSEVSFSTLASSLIVSIP